MQRNELRFRLYTFIKFNSKWITELNVKCKIIKFLEYNIFLGEKAGLKLNIQKTKIMASNPITSWQIEKGKSRSSDRLYFLGSKITADGDCSQESKRRLLLGRKAMKNLDSILKSKDITLPTKVIVKAMVVPVVMYGCNSWTIKKAGT